jgi:hypothetical protein
MIVPPTPTELPPATPFFNAFRAWSLWQTTSPAITSWNLLGDGRYVIQAVALVGIIIAGFYVVRRFAKDFTKQDSES